MQEYNQKNEQERYFSDSVTELQAVNRKLSKLILKKEQLTSQIISSLEHNHEGQKTYEYGTWKIEVKTPFVYSLNKKKYEDECSKIPDNYNPIKESISYSIDKKLCDQYLLDAPSYVKDILVELIDKKPGKSAVIIKERV